MNRKVWMGGLILLMVAGTLGGVALAADRKPAADRLPDWVARGTVTAVDGKRVSIRSKEGAERTLLVSRKTQMWVPGRPPTTTIELQVGDPVLALGQPTRSEAGGEVMRARLVVVVDDEELSRVAIRGRAVAVTRQTIVLQTGRGERAITVLPRTRLWSRGGRVSSLRDIIPGDAVLALGQPTKLGQWFAGLVVLLGSGMPAQPSSQGEVIRFDEEIDRFTGKGQDAP